MTRVDTVIDPTALGPLILLGLGAVAAMLFAPLRPRLAYWAAMLGLLAAAGLAAARLDAAPGAASALMADDPLARFGVLTVSLAAAASLLFGRLAEPPREAPALVAILAFGGAVLCGARHGTVLFLGLEVMSLALVALFAWPLSTRALEVAYKYFIMSGAGAAALLLGLALIYTATGSLAFAGWVPAQDGLFPLGVALLLAGLGFKFSLAPFHTWTPDAFEGAEPPTASLAGVASKIAVAVVLARLSGEAAGNADAWRGALALLAGASIIVGNLLALRQTSLIRLLGYSTVAHSGYIAAILSADTPLAQEAALFYVVSYAPALIGALCLMVSLGRGIQVNDLAGLVRRAPAAGALLVVMLVSMAGLPPAVGFIGKLYLFAALADAGAWALLAVAAIGSGLGIYYYARFFGAPFTSVETDTGGETADAPALRHPALLAACALLVSLLGIYPLPLILAVGRALP